MKPPSMKLIRPTVRMAKEEAGTVGSARIYVEVGAGTEQHVTFELKIAVQRRGATALPRVVGPLGTTSAQLPDEDQPDEEQDDPSEGPYITSLFGEKIPASRLKTKGRRFGRRR